MERHSVITMFEVLTNRTYDDTNVSHKVTVDMMVQTLVDRQDTLSVKSISISNISEVFNDNVFPPHVMKMIDRLTKKVEIL